MNSTDLVNATLASFLADPEPGVIALKGEWGVGKTYVWKKFIAEQKTVPGYRAYSYVSLFGIAGVSELRRAIFANQTPLGSQPGRIEFWAKRIVSRAARHVDIDLGVPMVGLKNTELWADAIEARMLRDCIVCLDDLERKEDDVTTSAVLGLITNLRDERRCKVILLFNANKAEEADEFISSLNEYREKVIDREIVLQPTVRECYELIFKDGKYDLPAGHPGPANAFQAEDHRSVVELFEALDLANIRVMRKTRLALDYFAAAISGKYPKMWPGFVRQVVKLSCLHYRYGEEVKLADIVDHNRWVEILVKRRRDGAEGEAIKKKYAPVEKIAYSPAATDRLIVDYLTGGFVDWEKNGDLLQKQEDEQIRLEKGALYHANWNLLWDNFQTTQEQFVDTQLTFLRQHAATMSLNEVSQLVEFLRRLQVKSPEAEAILTTKIDQVVEACAVVTDIDRDFYGLSKEVTEEIQKKLEAKVIIKPIPEAVALLADKSGWNSSDLVYLARYTEKDFLDWLLTEKDPGLLRNVKKLRERFGNDAAGKPIIEKLDGALRQLAKRSLADAQRVAIGAGLK